MGANQHKLLKIFSILICFSCCSSFAATDEKSLSVKQALESAFLHSPHFISAKSQLAAAELQSKNAFVQFLPSLDFNSSHGYRGVDPDPTSATSQTPILSSASIALTQNIYDNGESYKNYQIAKLNYELAGLRFKKTKAQIIQSVLLAYYRNNISIRNLKFTKINYAELERLAKLVSAQYHQGFKTRKDYLSFKTKAQRGHLDVITAEQNQISSRATLLITIGLEATDTTRFNENELPILPSGNLNFNIDPAAIYEGQILNLQRQIGELKVQLAKRKFWPELNLIGEASYGSSQYFRNNESWSDNDSTQWSVLLNLKMNLVDWGLSRRNVQISVAERTAEEQSYRSQLLDVQKELEVFKIKAKHSREGYTLAKELQSMEEDTFKLLERDYRSGKATYLELSTGLANLLDAQERGQEAEFSLAELYLQWKYYKGNLSEENISE